MKRRKRWSDEREQEKREFRDKKYKFKCHISIHLQQWVCNGYAWNGTSYDDFTIQFLQLGNNYKYVEKLAELMSSYHSCTGYETDGMQNEGKIVLAEKLNTFPLFEREIKEEEMIRFLDSIRFGYHLVLNKKCQLFPKTLEECFKSEFECNQCFGHELVVTEMKKLIQLMRHDFLDIKFKIKTS